MSDPHEHRDDPVYRQQIREIVRRTRAKQGLPPTVEDPVALDRIAELVLRAAVGAARREQRVDDLCEFVLRGPPLSELKAALQIPDEDRQELLVRLRFLRDIMVDSQDEQGEEFVLDALAILHGGKPRDNGYEIAHAGYQPSDLLSLAQVAEVLGVSVRTVQYWEVGS